MFWVCTRHSSRHEHFASNLRLYDDNSSRLYGLHTWLQCESIRARCKNSLEETNITSDEDRQAVDILQEYFYLVIQ